MPLFRRSPPGPAPLLVTDRAQDDAELARVRDAVVAGGRWEQAAELLASTAGDPDRRGAVVDVLAGAAVQPAPWLDGWLTARGDDPGAHVVAAWASVQRAWDARGGGWARQTGEDSFAAFFRLLDDAVPLCHRAVRTGPDDPTPWVVLLWVSIGRQEAREVCDDRWEQLTARDPHNRLGHIARLSYLCDKWHGSHELMYEFARSVTGPPWAPVVPLQAHAEWVLRETDRAGAAAVRGFWQSREVAADLDRAYAWAVSGPPRHAFALHDLTVVGYGLSSAERWAQAADVFELSSSRAYEYPWYYTPDPVRGFAQAHRQAFARRR